jgi:hypothetical protein
MKPMKATQRKAFGENLNQEIERAKFPTPPAQLRDGGSGWQQPFVSPLVTVHAALLRTGKVLFIAGSATDLRIFEQTCPNPNTREINSCPADPTDLTVCPPWGLTDCCAVWDVKKGTFSRPAIPLDNTGKPIDIFCVGHSFLPDGRLLAGGGTSGYAPDRGYTSTLLFDPITEKWIKVPAMNSGRWYPTFVTLGNGQVFNATGINTQGNDVDFNPEIFSSSGWTAFSQPTSKLPTYAQLFLLSNGKLFYSGASFNENEVITPRILTLPKKFSQPIEEKEVPGLYENPKKLNPENPCDQRNHATSVLLPPAQDQRVMIMGGGTKFTIGGKTTDTVYIADLDQPNPKYRKAPSLSSPRMHVNAVILPDRTVFVCNGSTIGEDTMKALLPSEIYNPATNTWKVVEAQSVPHVYHSIALLLPDGSVVTGGGTPTGACNELRMQIYKPSYMSEPRPTIQRAPEKLSYGAQFTIQTPQAQDIKWVNLIKPSATTHSCDTEQRLVDVPIILKTSSSLDVKITKNRNLAPPGWYMIFITNNNNVPSVASWIQLT